MTPEEKMTQLAESFGLELPGTDPWSAVRLANSLGVLSSGERRTALFLLAVWDRQTWSKKFDALEALAIWDDIRRAAFIQWAKNPWWA